jgi:hypothetical protein
LAGEKSFGADRDDRSGSEAAVYEGATYLPRMMLRGGAGVLGGSDLVERHEHARHVWYAATCVLHVGMAWFRRYPASSWEIFSVFAQVHIRGGDLVTCARRDPARPARGMVLGFRTLFSMLGG